ncbi:MAG: transglutaminase domain-containing protein [Planctomycetota bacterium]|jgi:hypothetical protein
MKIPFSIRSWRDAVARGPTRAYGILCALLYAVCVCALAAAALDRLLVDLVGFSPFFWIGFGRPPVGRPYEMAFFRYVLWGGIGLTVLFYLLFLGTKGRLARGGVLALCLLAHTASGALVFYPTHHLALVEQIRIVNLPSIDYETVFSKEEMLGADIPDYDAFYGHCRGRFLRHRDMLREKWGVEDEKTLEAYFYVNLVSRMYGYGNRDHPEKAGAVALSEDTGWKLVEDVTIRTCVESEIACCNDYVHLLAFLLKRAEIPARQVYVLGHIFNEARLGGGWVVLDATLGLVFHGSWEEIQGRDGGRKDAVRVTIFPHGNLVQEGRHYRSGLGHARLGWLLRVMDRTAPVVKYIED